MSHVSWVELLSEKTIEGDLDSSLSQAFKTIKRKLKHAFNSSITDV